MSFFKEVFKKVLIAVIIAVVTLGIVYVRDDYLKEDTSDIEMLHTTEISKDKEQIAKSVQKSVEKVVEKKVEPKQETVVKQEPQKIQEKVVQNTKEDDALFKPVQQQTFEDFKKQYSMN